MLGTQCISSYAYDPRVFPLVEKMMKPASADNRPKKTIAEMVIVPFAPMTIQRPLKLFKGILGLTPCVESPPDPDFLVHLLTGRSHQAWLRLHLGNQYKNLENLLRGRGNSTETTVALLQNKLHIENLRSHSHGSNHGPLFPTLVDAFQMIEGFYFQMAEGVSRIRIPCPHCCHDVNDDVDLFWQRQSLDLGISEYRFVERLLTAIVGGSLLHESLRNLSCSNGLGIVPADMADPRRHPIGNWLNVLSKYYGCRTLTDLQVRLPVDPSDPDQVLSYRRMRKWAAGHALLGPETASRMIQGAADETTLSALFLVARMVSLALDFAVAAAPNGQSLPRKTVQEILHHRLIEREGKVRLTISRIGAEHSK
jgi:hypothetical protein